MTSPALRRRQKVLAGLAARPAAATGAPPRRPSLAHANASPPFIPDEPGAPPVSDVAFNEYRALLAVLHDNIRNLSDIASHEQRQPKKAEYAKAFAAWIDGVIAADEAVQDDIIAINMIWALDYRDFDYALRLADFMIRHGLVVPNYTRTASCILAEEVAEQALKQHETVPHEVLLNVRRLTDGADMPDQVQAKLLKAIARSWYRLSKNFDPSADNVAAGAALSYLNEALIAARRALELDKDAGVKKDIQQLEIFGRKLDAAQPDGTPPTDSQSANP